MPGYGEGRRCALERAVSVMTAVNLMKTHLGLSHVRLALALETTLGGSNVGLLSLALIFRVSLNRSNVNL